MTKEQLLVFSNEFDIETAPLEVLEEIKDIIIESVCTGYPSRAPFISVTPVDFDYSVNIDIGVNATQLFAKIRELKGEN